MMLWLALVQRRVTLLLVSFKARSSFCLYPWLGERWAELVAVEIASFGGGRGSPERWKTVARGSSQGLAGSRQLQ